MKRYIGYGVAAVGALTLVTGCETGNFTYKGPDYVMFADTMYRYGVQQDNATFHVPVSATRTADHDRTFGVEVLELESNAIEGRHYRLLATSVTIPAGRLTAEVPVQGIYENIGATDSLGFALNLIVPESERWEHYGSRTKVVMQKVCPFDINLFTGYCKVSSTFFMSDLGPNVTLRLIRTERAPGTENTVILHDLLYDGYDVEITFDPSDPMAPAVTYPEQVCSTTGEVTGAMLAGDGNVLISAPTNYTSYFSTCENFVLQYFSLLVRNTDGSLYGSMGTYVNVLEWISDAEAEKLKEQGY